jgi:hypothetical protein
MIMNANKKKNKPKKKPLKLKVDFVVAKLNFLVGF